MSYAITAVTLHSPARKVYIIGDSFNTRGRDYSFLWHMLLLTHTLINGEVPLAVPIHLKLSPPGLVISMRVQSMHPATPGNWAVLCSKARKLLGSAPKVAPSTS